MNRADVEPQIKDLRTPCLCDSAVLFHIPVTIKTMFRSLYVTEENAALLTDLYQLTMAAAYWSHNLNEPATFEMYFRRLPSRRSYILFAGLEQALQYACSLKFTAEQIDWLRKLDAFRTVDRRFWDYLNGFRFTGDIWAIPEGTPVFPLEPMLQVRAPLMEAQIVETYLLSAISVQSMIATKAARVVQSAKGRGVVDFGARRAHGPQAALLAARAAYMGGCMGTSNVLAGQLAGIPVYGTAAHSFTMAFPTELEAFRAYYRVFPETTVLLIDTYDTLQAAKEVREVGPNVRGVRIDSGDLLDLSRKVRRILDENGQQSVKIFLSGDLNEYKIEDLLQRGACVDFFGVGTELVTSHDEPSLSCVYKMVEATMQGELRSRIKISPGKLSYPSRKQLYRFREGQYYSHDMLCISRETPPEGGKPLLESYVQNGKAIRDLPELKVVRERTLEELARLPAELHSLKERKDYPVVLSDNLKEELRRVEREYGFGGSEAQR